MRLMIVDDNEEFLRYARRLLERQGATVVGVATTREDALHLARDLRPDVALVDVRLGEESGFEVARTLSDLEPPRVVMISGYDGSEFRRLLAESPAIGFVSKPMLSAMGIAEMLAQNEGKTSEA